MRRWILFLLTALILLTATGCVRATQEEPGYPVYFLPQEMRQGQALVSESRILPKDADPIEDLLTCLLEGPESEDLTAAIPTGVTLKEWHIRNGLLTVDFSGRYGSLSGIALTLADYSVVRTLTQLDQVDSVEITADGEFLSYRDHQRMTAADTWSGQDPPEEETEPETE